MQSCEIICVGRLSADYFAAACREYEKRLSAYCRFRAVELPEERIDEKQASPATVEKALKKEGEAILSAAHRGTELVALCVEGKPFSSEQLAALLQKNALYGGGDVTFVIGSSHGLHPSVKQAAAARISISPMTFPHQLCRLILTEQIYRGYTINAGKRYHK